MSWPTLFRKETPTASGWRYSPLGRTGRTLGNRQGWCGDPEPYTDSIVDFSAYAGPRLTQFPNVRLHDFRVAKEITHDLSNYGDVIHHSPAIDLKVLSLLAERKYVVDRAAPTASLDRLKAQVEAYRVDNVERAPAHHEE